MSHPGTGKPDLGYVPPLDEDDKAAARHYIEAHVDNPIDVLDMLGLS